MRRLLTLVLVLSSSSLTFAMDPLRDPARERGRGWTAGEAMIVHPQRALTDDDRAELATKGILVRHALTEGRYLARVTPNADLADTRLTKVERLSPEMKLHRSARAEVGRGRTWAELNVIFHRDVPFDDARSAVLAAGGALADVLAVDYLPSQRLEIKVHPAGLEALALDERVLTILGRERFRIESHNATSAEWSGVAAVHGAPYGLTGEGVTVSLFELGSAQATHVEFGGRLTLQTLGHSPDNTHATHVSGTIAAAGVNAGAKGMAPKANVHQFCVTTSSCGGSWLTLKERDLASRGVVADNNSWGYVLGWSNDGTDWVWNDSAEYYGAYYLLFGAPIDDISIKKDVLFIHSAGNDGNVPQLPIDWSEHRHVDDDGDTIKDKIFCYSRNGMGNDCPQHCNGQPTGCEINRHHLSIPYDTIGVTASAKNVLAVGALTGTEASKTLAGFSSRGPAKDGRVKPDVVARGTSVLSTLPNNGYGRSQGTSMAAPVVTGVSALLTEQWRRTFRGANPSPAQLRAVIIAGTEDLGTPGPDYSYGFGLVNARNSADIIIADNAMGDRIRSVTVGQGQQFEFPFGVTAPQRLRVVLGWADPPIAFLGGDDIAAKALVNDIDLWIVGPQGEIHRPYVLNKNEPTASATRGVNNVDNTEMVEIASAAPGIYRIVVKGTSVSEGPQRAVLVSSTELAPECRDPQEPNDTPATAHGNLVPRQTVSGALCAQNDLDYFKFVATKAGAVKVTVTTFDTPVRATLSGSGVNTSVEVPANSVRTLNANATVVPLALVLKLEPVGTIGLDPRYVVVPEFGETTGPRRRSSR